MTQTVLMFLIGWFFLEAGATGMLPAPCRSWSSCNQLRCTSEQQYQSSLNRFDPCSSSGTSPSSPSDECAVVNGTCTFTDSAPNCTSWLPPCDRQYRCTTVEEYMNKTSEVSNCSPSTQVPSPDSLCEPINGSCQWYNPCRTWRGHCWAGYSCGSESDYWGFVYGPQPICSPPPPGWQTPTPPGKCIVQNGECDWTYCKPWLDWCQTYWLCGTNYEYRKYFSGYPPPCPLPPDNYHPPPEPGPCQFNVSSLSCGFNTSYVCPNGKQYKSCGPICPLTCGNYQNPFFCSLRCSQGCFCPDGMVELGEECVLPSQCPNVSVTCPPGKVYTTCGSACPLSCDNYTSQVPCTLQCVAGCFCPQGMVEYQGRCVQPSQCPSTTSQASSASDPCTAVSALPCPPNSRCLTVNTTGESFCLPSCFMNNGGCREDQVCTNTIGGGCSSTTQTGRPQCSSSVNCTDISDVQGVCPPGWEYLTCGSLCSKFSCDDYPVPKNVVCPAVCVSGCFCPSGLLVYRDRCVIPQECPSLLADPPAANPLPLDADTVMIQLKIPRVRREDFNSTRLAASIQQFLPVWGYPDVRVTVHAVFNSQQQLQVVLQFSGGAVSSESGSNLANLLTENTDTLPVDVTEVSIVDAPRLPQPAGLPGGTIAGIAITALAVGVFVVALVGFVMYLVIARKKMTKTAMSPDRETKDKDDVDTQGTTYSKLKEIENEEFDS